jgi:hypothetical protein
VTVDDISPHKKIKDHPSKAIILIKSSLEGFIAINAAINAIPREVYPTVRH